MSVQNVKTVSPFRKVINTLYEFGAPIISVVDVVTDIMVTFQFYQNGRMTFFWISLCILLLAQVCYSMLFTLFYADHWSTRWRMVAFACIFPLGQFVPLFMWLDSFKLKFVSKILKSMGLQSNAFDEKTCPEDMDELQFWLEQKLRSQGGFIIESIIEGI
ncbi:hypothetical protein RFI_26898 [Reticulomyxa filosa]|uniref:XK-related protein n=1 Tax=Reticulomyxa filosa TaxID=46433 RepID=X6M906_RETFI|nr:hypothetical protein RFI_26898 [Reticulomyxa filosa]|eukprot:ETO10478.1 hypothetical protein RFI_26898 [Reticulomyxa filosa]